VGLDARVVDRAQVTRALVFGVGNRQLDQPFVEHDRVGALVGRRLLAILGVQRERLVASAAAGVLLLHLIRLIPYAGSVLWALAWVAGFGAVAAEVYLWGRARRARRGAAAELPGAPPAA
jgi:hypothetical protein